MICVLQKWPSEFVLGLHVLGLQALTNFQKQPGPVLADGLQVTFATCPDCQGEDSIYRGLLWPARNVPGLRWTLPFFVGRGMQVFHPDFAFPHLSPSLVVP